MLISGLVKSSLIDYPEKIAAVIFTSGCNFRCPYCHNPDVVFGKGEIKADDVLRFLFSRKGKLDGVVITGGEPTLQKDLTEFLYEIKSMGFSIKLDTNGSRFDVLNSVFEFLDYIAMDIKGPLKRYGEITNSLIDYREIEKTMKFLKKSKVPFEYRTTVVKGILEEEDFYTIKENFKEFGVPEKYYLQYFRPDITLEKEFQKIEPYCEFEMQKFKKIFDGFCSCFIR